MCFDHPQDTLLFEVLGSEYFQGKEEDKRHAQPVAETSERAFSDLEGSKGHEDSVEDTDRVFQKQRESKWISFRRNPRIKTGKDERVTLKALAGEYLPESRFYGNFLNGERGIIFPRGYAVEQELIRLSEKDPEGPWILPVFVECSKTERPRIFRAYLIDEVAYAKFLGKFVSKEELQSLQERIALLEQDYSRLRKFISKKLMVYIDFQNLYHSMKQMQKKIDITLIDKILSILSGYHTEIPKVDENKKLVYIFDFYHPGFSHFYSHWHERGYHFIEVHGGLDNNPTDTVMIEHAKDMLIVHREKIDTFCLVSGDGDFAQLLVEMKSNKLEVIVAGFQNTHQTLRTLADIYCDLTEYFH